MKPILVTVAGLGVAITVSLSDAHAEPGHAPVVSRTHARCCEVAAGTVVEVELSAAVSSKTQKTGDSFAFRLAAPLVADRMIVLPKGTQGVGEVVDSSPPGMGGKPAKLVLAARYLQRHGLRVPLQGLRLAAAGKNNTTAAEAVGLAGIALGPVGFAGLAISGGQVVFPAGTEAVAKVSSDVSLPAISRARAGLADSTIAAPEVADTAPGDPIAVPAPPPGEGLVVFFRRKSLMGTAQWFNVREDGRALGKLTNGAYFMQAEPPGVHTYTAKTEFKDSLKLQVDPGETYYVEGALTRGLVIGEADLAPSTHVDFESSAKDMKPAPPGSADDQTNGAGEPANAAANTTDSNAAPANDVGSNQMDTNQAR
jgi:hypothetical protein